MYIYNDLGCVCVLAAGLLSGILGYVTGSTTVFFLACGILLFAADLFVRARKQQAEGRPGLLWLVAPSAGGHVQFIPCWGWGALAIVLAILDAMLWKVPFLRDERKAPVESFVGVRAVLSVAEQDDGHAVSLKHDRHLPLKNLTVRLTYSEDNGPPLSHEERWAVWPKEDVKQVLLPRNGVAKLTSLRLKGTGFDNSGTPCRLFGWSALPSHQSRPAARGVTLLCPSAAESCSPRKD